MWCSWRKAIRIAFLILCSCKVPLQLRTIGAPICLHWTSSNIIRSAIFQDARICPIGKLTEGREVVFELCSIEDVFKDSWLIRSVLNALPFLWLPPNHHFRQASYETDFAAAK
jgi:hypothetical protein